jgi:DNA-binding LacI/PurR family transcriptional regulator
MKSQNPPTIRHIAAELGLSMMTVSRALRGHSNVSEETRQRVLECAERMNYRPNRSAQSLVTGKTFIAGIVIPDISHTFFAEVTQGAEEVLDEAGYDLILCHSREDPERERGEVEMLVSGRVDGLIVASAQPADAAGVYRKLQKRGFPVVLIDRYFTGMNLPLVRVDDRAVGRMAAEHLIGLGHLKIGFIQGGHVSTAVERFQGFRECLQENGVDLNPAWVIPGDLSFESGWHAMHELIAMPEMPTAVCAANDPAAMGAAEACLKAGLRVPQDVSIIGAGAIEGDHHPFPFLTTVSWSRKEIGREAARLLLANLAGKLDKTEAVILPAELLVRRSTSPPRA